MSSTSKFKLPLIADAQADKHLPHNEAINYVDQMLALDVISDVTATPPSSPAANDTYILPASGRTGAWLTDTDAGSGKIAFWFVDPVSGLAAGWRYITPKNGLKAWFTQYSTLKVYKSGTWQDVGGGGSGAAPVEPVVTVSTDGAQPVFNVALSSIVAGDEFEIVVSLSQNLLPVLSLYSFTATGTQALNQLVEVLSSAFPGGESWMSIRQRRSPGQWTNWSVPVKVTYAAPPSPLTVILITQPNETLPGIDIRFPAGTVLSAADVITTHRATTGTNFLSPTVNTYSLTAQDAADYNSLGYFNSIGQLGGTAWADGDYELRAKYQHGSNPASDWSNTVNIIIDTTSAETIAVTSSGTVLSQQLLLTAGGAAFTNGEPLTVQRSITPFFQNDSSTVTQTPPATAGATNTYTWPTAGTVGVTYYFRFRRSSQNWSNIASKLAEADITFGSQATFASTGSNTNVSTAALSIGAEAANRFAFIMLHVDDCTTTPVSYSVNGTSRLANLQLAAETGASGGVRHRFFYDIVPMGIGTGTTVQIVADLSNGSTNRNFRGFVKAIFASAVSLDKVLTSTLSASSDVSTTHADTITFATTDGGVAFMGAGHYTNASAGWSTQAAWTPASATEIADIGSLNRNGSYAYRKNNTSEAVTVTFTRGLDSTSFSSLSGMVAVLLKGT